MSIDFPESGRTERNAGMVPFLPFLAGFKIFFGLLLFLIFLLIEIKVLGYAFEKVGINHRYVFLVLLLTFIGSAINIPIAEVMGNVPVAHEIADGFGRVVFAREKIIVAVNVGGAVIPTFVSLHLLVRMSHTLRAVLAVAVVAAVSHIFATPLPGVGITIPAFIPPIAAALCAVLLCRKEAAQIAYISGSMGTMIGADLLNLGRVADLASNFVSIGGAGTFDGIFFSSIIAVLLVSI